MHEGTIIGLVGSALGVGGGVIACCYSIKNTNGPRERLFMIKASIVCFAGVTIFLLAQGTLPDAYRWILFIPYFILLYLGTAYGKKVHKLIREQESE